MKKLLGLSLILIFALVVFADNNTDAQNQHTMPTLKSPINVGISQEPILGDRSELLFDQAATGYYTFDACQWDSVYPFEAEIADNFSVPFETDVDSLVWWGGYWNGTPTLPVDFWIKIYEDSTGASGPQPKQAPIYVARVSFTEQNLGLYYQYTAKIPPFHAFPGTRYWIEFEPTLLFPPQWGNNCSWPANNPGWGDGQQMYFKSAVFGFPQWVPATTVFGNPHESSFQIYGTTSAPVSYIWDFETGHQGWTHTNGQAFPAGWDVQWSQLHASWACPSPGDSSYWIDSDAAGTVTINDTAYSPAVRPPMNMFLLKFGYSFYWYSGGYSEKLAVGVRVFTGGAWQAPVELRSWQNASSGPAWDSVDVSAYASAESIRVYFAYTNAYWEWYAAFDNVELRGSLPHDVGTIAIAAPGTTVFPNTAINPVATYKNFGQNNETFNCYFKIDSSGTTIYNQFINVTLPAGEDTTLTFPTWTTGPNNGITYNVYAFTALGGDANPSNDTISKTTVTQSSFWKIYSNPMPAPNYYHACVYTDVTGTPTVYSLGGNTGSATNAIYAFNCTNETWTTLSTVLNHATQRCVAAVVDGKIYVIGGGDDSFNALNYNQEFDPVAGTVIDRANLPVGRHFLGAVAWRDTLIYVIGGQSGSTYYNSVDIYNPANNTWTTGTNLPTTNRSFAIGISGDTIFVAGGYNGDYVTNLYIGVINPTNPQSITWSQGPNIPTGPSGTPGRSRVQGACVLGKFYFTGGDDHGVPAYDTWYYDPADNQWHQSLNKPTPISNAQNAVYVPTLNGGTFFCPGGYNTASGTATNATEGLINLGVYGISEKPDAHKINSTFGFASNMSNPTKDAVIVYTLTRTTNVSLKVFDVTGKLVTTLVNGMELAGTRKISWDTKNLANGIYFLKLEAEGKVATHKLILVK